MRGENFFCFMDVKVFTFQFSYYQTFCWNLFQISKVTFKRKVTHFFLFFKEYNYKYNCSLKHFNFWYYNHEIWHKCFLSTYLDGSTHNWLECEHFLILDVQTKTKMKCFINQWWIEEQDTKTGQNENKWLIVQWKIKSNVLIPNKYSISTFCTISLDL